MNFITIYEKYVAWRDRHFPMGRVLRHMPYALIFKTTNWCWYQCSHCCESSGPKNRRTFIPADTICNYLDQAAADESFGGNVVFTGGEIMSSYLFGPDGYAPKILNKSLDLGIGTDIKTNAAWVRAGFGEKIFADLHDVVSKHEPYTLQISLSLDRYHKNSLENNAILISRLAQMPDMRVNVHVSGFDNHVNMMPQLLERISANGVSVEQVLYGNGMDNMQMRTLVGDQVLLWQSNATLFDGGRAKNLDGAYHTEFPQFKFLDHDNHSLIALDSFGRATLGENSGRKICTGWSTTYGDKSLMEIRADLVRATWREETRARLFQGWRFDKEY